MKRVLLVDDDDDILDYMSQLIGQDVECHTANSFENFTKSFSERKYDLIVTDLNLGNGKTAKDILKYTGTGTAVIVMTGGIESKLQQKILMGLGCKEIVTKPISKKQILDSLLKYSH